MRYTIEYRYRRIAAWFERKASKLAAARTAREVMTGRAYPYKVKQ